MKRNETEQYHKWNGAQSVTVSSRDVFACCWSLWYTFDETNGDKNRNNVSEKSSLNRHPPTVNLCATDTYTMYSVMILA